MLDCWMYRCRIWTWNWALSWQGVSSFEGHKQKESRLEDLNPDYTYRNFCWTIVEKSGTARDLVSAAESSHIPLWSSRRGHCCNAVCVLIILSGFSPGLGTIAYDQHCVFIFLNCHPKGNFLECNGVGRMAKPSDVTGCLGLESKKCVGSGTCISLFVWCWNVWKCKNPHARNSSCCHWQLLAVPCW